MTADRIAAPALAGFATDVLTALDVPRDDAELVADSLVQADLWGHSSHGLLRLPWYAARLRSGAMTARTRPAVLADAGALVLLDGRDGIGQVLTERARTLAMERARAHGVGLVGVRNSNHFGTAMYFTRRAAEEGCVAMLTTNASPAMAPWGGREKVLGTNPWSIAAPGPDGRVVAVDIANTAVARGKIYLAESRGEPIPETWALTAEGAPTTDPAEGVLGVILPMAGHKGYAITFLMDVLSGALTGSGIGTDVHGPYEPEAQSRCGHLFLAVDTSAFGDVAGYEQRVRRLIDQVKGVPLAHGFDEVFYPGELEDRNAAANITAGGVLVSQQTRTELHQLARDLDVPAGALGGRGAAAPRGSSVALGDLSHTAELRGHRGTPCLAGEATDDERSPDDVHRDRSRRLQRRGTCRDEAARRRAARRGEERRQEGRRVAGAAGRHREDDAGGPCSRRTGARDGVRQRAGPGPQDLVRHARLRERGRQGRPLAQELGQVRAALLDPGVPGLGPPRRRGHVAGVVRAHHVDSRGGEGGRRPGDCRDLLTAVRTGQAAVRRTGRLCHARRVLLWCRRVGPASSIDRTLRASA